MSDLDILRNPPCCPVRLSTDDSRLVLHCVSKRLPPLNSLQLCQMLTDFQNFCTVRKHMKFATKSNPYNTARLTLGMLLHYLGKLKMQIFCRYSAHMEENANKLHFSSPLLLLFIHKFRYFQCLQ